MLPPQGHQVRGQEISAPPEYQIKTRIGSNANAKSNSRASLHKTIKGSTVNGKNLKQHVGKMLADAPLPRKDSQRVANAEGLQMMAT